ERAERHGDGHNQKEETRVIRGEAEIHTRRTPRNDIVIFFTMCCKKKPRPQSRRRTSPDARLYLGARGATDKPRRGRLRSHSLSQSWSPAFFCRGPICVALCSAPPFSPASPPCRAAPIPSRSRTTRRSCPPPMKPKRR